MQASPVSSQCRIPSHDDANVALEKIALVPKSKLRLLILHRQRWQGRPPLLQQVAHKMTETA